MEASLALAHPCCPRCSALGEYVRQLADAMGLRDWTIDVDHGPPRSAGNDAEVAIAEGRRLARVFVLDELEGEDYRHALVHELVHVQLAPLMEKVLAGVRDELGGTAFRMYQAGVRAEAERATDVLASALAPHLPLP